MKTKVRFLSRLVVLQLAVLLPWVANAQDSQGGAATTAKVEQATLIAPGSSPFHLKAIVTEGREREPYARIEMYWVSQNKWRRTIQSDEFSQTLIVNGDSMSEEDSSDYFPLGLQTLTTALVDPSPIIAALRPGDRVQTKSNGEASESGVMAFGNIRAAFPGGLHEVIGASGHSVQFTNYQNFKGKRVARTLINGVGVGEFLIAQITDLEELRHSDDKLFRIASQTAKEQQIRSMSVREEELRALAVGAHEVIWPQVLDGATTGTSTFYFSVDRTGRVREVLPLHSANERSNDSARRQLLKWKFKPLVKDGVPLQAESILSFNVNTRAWGPAAPLSDEDARKLAANIVEPSFPARISPAGSTYTLMIAVDSDGQLIEAIPGEGPGGAFLPCYEAVKKWKFSPIMENGKPRPYRAEIKCKAS